HRFEPISIHPPYAVTRDRDQSLRGRTGTERHLDRLSPVDRRAQHHQRQTADSRQASDDREPRCDFGFVETQATDAGAMAGGGFHYWKSAVFRVEALPKVGNERRLY